MVDWLRDILAHPEKNKPNNRASLITHGIDTVNDIRHADMFVLMYRTVFGVENPDNVEENWIDWYIHHMGCFNQGCF